MTADRRAALVERVARAMCLACDPDAPAHKTGLVLQGSFAGDLPAWKLFTNAATAAVDLIWPEVLEEAARVVRGMPSPSSEWMADELLRALGGFENRVPDAIRALKEKQ